MTYQNADQAQKHANLRNANNPTAYCYVVPKGTGWIVVEAKD
jgi:hypothetical protein